MTTIRNICLAGLVAILAACGPSAKEVEAQNQAKALAAEEAANKARLDNHLQSLKPKQDALLEALKKERKIKDLSWLNEGTNSLLVGVIGDGSRWDGFAESICMIMTDNKLYSGIVRVMDASSATRGDWNELGRADCPSEGQSATVTMVEFGPGGAIKSETAISREEHERMLKK